MSEKVQITLQATSWSGWDPEGYPIVTWAKVWAAKGKVLGPATLGRGGSGADEPGPMSYEIVVEHVVADRVGFAYKRLVIGNPDGTINLTAPNSGKFILRIGESKNLSTPTMDAGISVVVTVHEIR